MPPRRGRGGRRGPQNSGQGNRSIEDSGESRVDAPPPPARNIGEVIARHNPPTFDGSGEPAAAETWIREMEKLFRKLRCNEAEKIECVLYQLQGTADYWWESRQRTMTEDALAALTWDQFRTEFLDKYVPLSYRVQKENEFYSLQQNRLSVTEYDRKFCELSRYAHDHVDTEAKKARRFAQGLRPEIRMAVAILSEASYREILSKALDVEAAMPAERNLSSTSGAQPSGQKRKWPEGNRGQPSQQRDQHRWQYQGPPRQHPAPPRRGDTVARCPRCGRHHQGGCTATSKNCYTCGRPGHYANQCRNRAAPEEPTHARPVRAMRGRNQPNRRNPRQLEPPQ